LPVSVSASGVEDNPPLALIAHGTLANGSELGDLAREEDGAFYFSFEEDRGTGFFVQRRDFRRARWDGPALEVTVGRVFLRIEPEGE
jgi:hypothetical protein